MTRTEVVSPVVGQPYEVRVQRARGGIVTYHGRYLGSEGGSRTSRGVQEAAFLLFDNLDVAGVRLRVDMAVVVELIPED